jgi:hypothetical protein
MTVREKFRKTALGQRGGLPRFEALGFWDETLERWHHEGLPKAVNPWEFFNLEHVWDNAPTGIAWHTELVLAPPFWPRFPQHTLDETDEYIVRTDGDGITARWLKRGTSMPQFIAYPVRGNQDWEGVKARLDPEEPERYRDLSAAAEQVSGRDTLLRFGMCGAYGTLRSLFGPEGLSYALYDSPELIGRILAHWARFYCTLADHFCPVIDFDYAFLWEDMACNTGPLLSPAHFRQLILPVYREVIGYLRNRHGIRFFMVDSDGNNWDLLPLFAEAGVNIMIPLEIAARMEPLAIGERFPEMILMGGIDKRALIHGGDEIKREIERKVPPLLVRGRYFPSVDHHIPPDVSLDSFIAYLELMRAVESSASATPYRS